MNLIIIVIIINLVHLFIIVINYFIIFIIIKHIFQVVDLNLDHPLQLMLILQIMVLHVLII